MNTSSELTSRNRLEKGRPIFSVSPFTLLDFPDRTACILWFAGCNMRCAYCYNPEIVLGKGKLSWGQIQDFLLARRRLLDGVVFSGGECTIHPQVIPLIHEVKKMGFEVKIDTNGSRPEVIRQLIEDDLVDYVALDFKAMAQKYEQITQTHLFFLFEKSLEILIPSKVQFEVRTTVHSDQLTIEDLQEMVTWLRGKGYSGNYYLQHFRGEKQSLGRLGESKKPSLKTEIGLWRN
ncbi:anaerobic ribonucleoside-triphosphate reductase activating protein [Algoriphagus sp.]|uniref:anaerobic ribonucleoside-triphosphate reductase activating protein n=1 Tax=Algoriphagus sp. TaxID=1872435 RepID=UPI00262A622A|nr:anaerobic ribonucleoside-triphosphate reductase activating protein [Algoriphagus sp.]